MFDIKLIREDAVGIAKKLKTKDPEVDLSKVIQLDKQYRDLKMKVEALKAERNAISKMIGELKRKNEDAGEKMQQVTGKGDDIARLEEELSPIKEKLNFELACLPNLPTEEIKDSTNVADNICLKDEGIKPSFDFPFKNHLELNEIHRLFDFERAAKVSGGGWPAYRSLGAGLEWALICFMIDIHVKNGFIQWIPPLLVRKKMMFASGQLPKFEGQAYCVEEKGNPLYLIPTAEVALNALHFDEILSAEELPLKYVAYTPCFRREAGAAGKQERGLIRTHQFNKVEMFAFTKPDQSNQVFDSFINSAEEILKLLELHYRVMLLVTGDMSFSAAKTVDLEVWLPGQDRYYEVSSVSNCTDFQARRSNVRHREKGEKPRLVHTLNGSGLATSRLMVALLENNQNADGSITLPKALIPYLGGVEVLKPPEESC